MMLATEMMLAENNTVSSGWDVLEVEQSAFVALIFTNRTTMGRETSKISLEQEELAATRKKHWQWRICKEHRDLQSLLLAVFLATTVLLMLALELRRQLVRVRAAVMAVRTTEMAVRLVRMRFAGA
jgi:hypothetical protein